MANERQRAEKLESQFQQLLEELKAQDEQIESLFAQAGVSRDAAPDVSIEEAERFFGITFEDAVEEHRAELVRQNETPPPPVALSGLFLRA